MDNSDNRKKHILIAEDVKETKETSNIETSQPFNKAEFLNQVEGEMELAKDLVRLLLDEDYPKQLSELQKAVSRRDSKTLENAAHAFKGLVGAFCAGPAYEAALRLEMMGRNGVLSRLDEEYTIFEKEIKRLKQALVALITPSLTKDEERKSIMDNSDNQKKRILVAEDVKVISYQITRAMESQGFDVDLAQDGEQCLEKIQSFKPDLVILDLMMPKVHGIDILKKMRSDADAENIGAIVCTAKSFKIEHELVKELGAFDIVVKPIQMDELVAKVKRFFSKEDTDVQQTQSRIAEPKPVKVFKPTIEGSCGRICLWGARGSIPISGPQYVRHGGNTSCMEVNCGDEIIIFDAGSGIRDLGLELMKQEHRKLHIFITHTHWDHIQGFPFFVPAFVPGFDITIYGAEGFGKDLESVFRGQLDRDYFPVQLEDMNANLEFKHLNENPVQIGNYKVYWEFAHHPGATVGYKIDIGGKKIVWLPDDEFLQGYLGSPDNITLNSEIVAPYLKLIEFMSDIDISISEAQYTNEEYVNKVGWGQSSLSNACLLMKLAMSKSGLLHIMTLCTMMPPFRTS